MSEEPRELRATTGESILGREPDGTWRLAVLLALADRPGELAEVSDIFARHEANITAFRFNRGEDPNLVRVAATLPEAATAGLLARDLAQRGWMDPPAGANRSPEPAVTDLGGLLTMRLVMADRPGALARSARIMTRHGANVIHMSYDATAAPGVAEFTLVTRSPAEVEALLDAFKRHGYHFHVTYRGGEADDVDRIIGLSAVESFLFKLRSILPADTYSELSELIESSDFLRRTLREFRAEAGGSGESLAASEIFTDILQLAAASATRTGENFSLTLTGPLRVTDRVRIYMIACPTGANAWLLELEGGREYALVDSSYGLYYPDACRWLAEHGMDPARIRRAFFTHPDADHAGFAAPLQEDYGTEIYMPPRAEAVLDSENRAHGSGSPLEALNLHYTRLINRFTGLRRPAEILPYPDGGGSLAGFEVIGRVTVGDVQFAALASLGGHVASQAFLLDPEHGLLFSGDYLIDVQSLSDRTKSTLSLARRLMTSTNIDSALFAREMAMLKTAMLEIDAGLAARGRMARVFPGHGQFYAVRDAGWEE